MRSRTSHKLRVLLYTVGGAGFLIGAGLVVAALVRPHPPLRLGLAYILGATAVVAAGRALEAASDQRRRERDAGSGRGGGAVASGRRPESAARS